MKPEDAINPIIALAANKCLAVDAPNKECPVALVTAAAAADTTAHLKNWVSYSGISCTVHINQQIIRITKQHSYFQ